MLLEILFRFLAPYYAKKPRGIIPVSNFDLHLFMGEWHELARLDHSFESGLTQVTARYKLDESGAIQVINRGYHETEGEWHEQEGIAFMMNEERSGWLKLSFFPPLYTSYIVFEIDQDNYQYAFVTGHNHQFLWLLSRSPVLDEALKSKFIKTAQSHGFKIDELIFSSCIQSSNHS